MSKKTPQIKTPPYLNSDPAHWQFQYLEDIATGYWYAQVLFSAVELNLFGCIEAGGASPSDLAAKAACKLPVLLRLLPVLEHLDLIHNTSAGLVNSQLARRFLVPGMPDYMGDFILYRRYMQDGWRDLTSAVACRQRPAHPDLLSRDHDYATRNFHYVRAMDRLARLKAREIVAVLDPEVWKGPVLDLGGGAGALCRALIRTQAERGRSVSATLFELEDVVEAARRIYPEAVDWENMGVMTGDFRTVDFPADHAYGVVVASNFLHAYAGETARRLLFKAAALTAADGVLLIHDYFPDRSGARPHKGALYDLNMLLNTFDGGCQPAKTISSWLREAGLPHILTVDLESDSTIMLAGRSRHMETIVPPNVREQETLKQWSAQARQIGFGQARLIRTDQIRTASWSREKCRFGCAGYGRNHMCPPGGIDATTMARMLKEYAWAIMVVGTPPGKAFHDQLLTLEKAAFLSGLHKALAFGAGPCPVCKPCKPDGDCRHPDLARPSMEGSGIDVYETARAAGICIEPVTEPGRYVKYVGMILLM